MLRARGHDVCPAVRRAVPDLSGAIVLGDLEALPDWGSALSGIDCVVHCAARAHVLKEQEADPLATFRAINRDATLSLARSAREAGVRRFVFISSIGVLGNETRGRPLSARDPIAPHSDYAVAKAEAEIGLREIEAECGMEVVIIRPPLVLGKGAKGNLGVIARALRRHVPLPLGLATKNRRHLISLDTLADLVTTCTDHPAAAGQTFLAADPQPISTRAIVERIAMLEGLRPVLLPIPLSLVRASLRALGARNLEGQLLGDLEIDTSDTRQRLGWQPPRLGGD